MTGIGRFVQLSAARVDSIGLCWRRLVLSVNKLCCTEFYCLFARVKRDHALHWRLVGDAENTMKNITMMLLLAVPAVAFAFPFEVETQLNGAEISINTLDLGNNMPSVSLSNYGARDAVCKVRFRNGPEAPRTRKAHVAAGETAHLTARFNSTVIKMRVMVECKQD